MQKKILWLFLAYLFLNDVLKQLQSEFPTNFDSIS